MLDKLKTNFKKCRLYKANSDNDLFAAISNNLFPYSCLVEDDVLLTKNGEIFKTIEIRLTDFLKNENGGLRDAVRRAISDNSNDLKTAFWIHTVKRKKRLDIDNRKIVTKNFLLRKIDDIIGKIRNCLNQYDVLMYITVVKRETVFSISPLNMFKLHGIFVDKNKALTDNVKSLHETVRNIVKDLGNYNPRILGIRTTNVNTYSELMEFLYFIVNHEDKDMVIEPIDITEKINESEYVFKNGKMLFKNRNNRDVNVASIFTIKEIQDIDMSTVSEIINNVDNEMIITEYVNAVDKKCENNRNNYIRNNIVIDTNDKFDSKMEDGKVMLNSKGQKYYQSSISIVAFSDLNNGYGENDVFLKCADAFASKGIVIVREDIGLERSYYAMMPANFSFIYRLSTYNDSAIGVFAYSYVFADLCRDIFIRDCPLLSIGTLSNNPVQIGFLKGNSSILVSGPDNCDKGVIVNLLVSSWLNLFDSNVFYVELNRESRAFVDSIGGSSYHISTDSMKNNAIFNLLDFSFFKDKNDFKEYLFDMLLLMMSSSGVVDEKSLEIVRLVADAIFKKISNSKQDVSFTLSTLNDLFKSIDASEYLKDWYLIGKYYHLFDNPKDVFSGLKMAHFYIDESISEKSNILSVVVRHLFSRIMCIARYSNKPTVVVIDEPFLLFADSCFGKQLLAMKDMIKNIDMHFVFKISDFKNEMLSSNDFAVLIDLCGLQIHFANQGYLDSNYMRIFHLSKMNFKAINALSNFDGMNFFVKRLDEDFCCQLHIDDKKALSILSDVDSYAYNNILNIKKEAMNNDPNTYIPTYFDT